MIPLANEDMECKVGREQLACENAIMVYANEKTYTVFRHEADSSPK